MRQGKYVVVDGKYVHSSDLAKVSTKQIIQGVLTAIVVVTLFYVASFCV